MVALAPFFILTLLGAVLIQYLPLAIVPPLIFGLAMNAGGSVGDFAVVWWLTHLPGQLLVEDLGDEVHVYMPK